MFGFKVRLANVRKHLSLVQASFSNLSAQQVRDKLWTITCQVRRKSGDTEGKRNEK